MSPVPLLAILVALASLWTGGVGLLTWIEPGTVPGARSWTDALPLSILGLGLAFVGIWGGVTRRQEMTGGTRLGLLAAALLIWAMTATRVAGLAPVAMASRLGMGPAAAPAFLVLGLLLGLFVLGALGTRSRFGLLPRERPLLAFVVLVAGNGKLMAAQVDEGLAMVTLMALLSAALLAQDVPGGVLVRRLRARLVGWPLWLGLALLAWWMVTSATAHNTSSAWRMTWRLVGVSLATLTCLGAITDERAAPLARRALDGLVVGLGATLVFGLWGVVEAVSVFPMGDVLASRLRILGTNPNLMGAYLAMGLPLVLGWLLAGRGGQVTLGRRLAGSLLVAGLATALYLTRSRSALLAALVGCGLFLVAFGLPAGRALLGRLGTRAVAAVFLVGALAACALVSPLGDGLRADLDQRATTQSALGQRWHFWRMATEATMDEPVTGLGPANFMGHARYARPSYYDGTVQTWHTHNIFLAALEGGGFLGLGLFTLWLVAFLGLLTRFAGGGGGSTGPGPAIGIWAAAIGLLVANQLDLGQSQLTFVPHFYWVFLLVACLATSSSSGSAGSEAEAGPAPAPWGALVLAWPAGLALLFGFGLSDLARRAASDKDMQSALRLGELAASPVLVADEFNLWNNIGKWREKLGDVDGSLEALAKSAAGHPNSAQGWHRLTMAQLKAGRVEDAGDSADRSWAADPRGVGAAGARALQAWVAILSDRPEEGGALLLEALAGGASLPPKLPVKKVESADGGRDVMLGDSDVSLLALLTDMGEGLVAQSATDELTARRAIPGLATGFRYLERPLDAAEVVGRMATAMPNPIRSVYYAWIELLVDGGAIDEARAVLAASDFRDEPSMRDLFPGEGDPVEADLAVFGADLFYTHGNLGDLFLQQALLQVQAGDRAAAERTMAQALYISSDSVGRAALSHEFLTGAQGTAADKRSDLLRYLEAASLSPANIKHTRRMGDAARTILQLAGGKPARARELLDELAGGLGAAMHEALAERLEGVLRQR